MEAAPPSVDVTPRSRDAFKKLNKFELTDEFMKAPIPLGPSTLLYGQLKNRMTYYVRPNEKPKERAALALAVRVGSVLETEEERGVAHILEHLAFSATHKYSNHEIVRFLESIGAEFGACQNAYTSAEETVFELLVPIDKDDVLDKAFSVLAQFCREIRISDSDLEKERGAVLDEWRQGRDSRGRAAEAYWKLAMGGSKYADRLPIGLEKVIRNVSAATIRGFYDRWYRPEHMAVVAIGNFEDTQAVKDLIFKHFEGVQPATPGPGPEIPTFGFEEHPEPRFSTFSDHETLQTAVHVTFKCPSLLFLSPVEYKACLAIELFHSVLNQRFFKLSHTEDPPFYQASSISDEPVKPVMSYSLSASVEEGGAARALEAMLTEVARVRLHGFTEREVAIAKARTMADLESSYLERDQFQSEDLRDEYLQHFLRHEPVPGVEYEMKLAKTLLPEISVAEVNAVGQYYRFERSCIVKTVENKQRVKEAELRAVLVKVAALEASQDLEPWQEDDIPTEIVRAPPASGHIVKKRKVDQIDAVELVLSNGMRVCYKKTDFLDDQLLMRGFAYGGLSELPEEEFRSAAMAASIAGEMGIFGFKPAVLSEMLAGKRVAVAPSISAYRRGFNGDCSPDDLETSLQLLYQLFHHETRPVEQELKVVMRMTREAIVAQNRDPLKVYGDRVRFLNYGNCYFYKPVTLEEFDRIDPHYSCQYFNNCFRNPAEFTVVLVGTIHEDELLALLEKFVAGIPPVGEDFPPPKSKETLKPLPFQFPDGILVEDVKLPMIEEMCATQITFPIVIKTENAVEEAYRARTMTRVVETKLMQMLRFKYGEVYSVSVTQFYGGAAPTKDVRGDLAVNFSCDPASAPKLIDLTLEELSRLQEEGPTKEDVETAVELEKRAYEMGMQENSFWVDRIIDGYISRTFKGDIGESCAVREATRLKVLSEMSPETIRATLRRVLPYPCTEHYTAITLLPKVPVWRQLMQRAISPSFLLTLGIGALSALFTVWRKRRQPSATTS
eukprot:jgi/Mesvir1/26948/Mv20668-RA.1